LKRSEYERPNNYTPDASLSRLVACRVEKPSRNSRSGVPVASIAYDTAKGATAWQARCINVVYHACAFLSLVGILSAFLPNLNPPKTAATR